ncbi:hypothetical protein STCU_10805 [Strigomonas culicis]|uniref:Uncharacterized protein n=1 Tax=Strigomonas culicis TaxID=28005 RepID=S9TJZ6_9TRYP|nr:hypothetical protein STCU_10805 [Strigomonas culicis]|eukprot:EPY17134.1 hypothetical protein STCU_10805 [Strigomonas culicis]
MSAATKEEQDQQAKADYSSIDKATIFDHVSREELMLLLSTVTVTDDNEVLVQFVATKLLDQFFSFFETIEQGYANNKTNHKSSSDRPAYFLKSVRDYIFSVCIKMCAMTEKNNNLLLLDHNVHIQSICKRQHISLYTSSSSTATPLSADVATGGAAQHGLHHNMGDIVTNALASIFYCCLLEEMAQLEGEAAEGPRVASDSARAPARKGGAQPHGRGGNTPTTATNKRKRGEDRAAREAAPHAADAKRRQRQNVLLPPPVLLFPFMSVGKDTLVGVCVPKSALEGAAAVPRPAPSHTDGLADGVRTEEGEFLNCRIASRGIQVPPFRSFLTRGQQQQPPDGGDAKADALFSYEVVWLDEAPPSYDAHTPRGSAPPSDERCARPLDGLLPFASPPAASPVAPSRVWSLYEGVLGGFAKLHCTVHRSIFMRDILEKGEDEKRTSTTGHANSSAANTKSGKGTAGGPSGLDGAGQKDDPYVYYGIAPKKPKRKPFVLAYDRQMKRMDPLRLHADTHLAIGENLLLLYGDTQSEAMTHFLKPKCSRR